MNHMVGPCTARGPCVVRVPSLPTLHDRSCGGLCGRAWAVHLVPGLCIPHLGHVRLLQDLHTVGHVPVGHALAFACLVYWAFPS